MRLKTKRGLATLLIGALVGIAGLSYWTLSGDESSISPPPQLAEPTTSSTSVAGAPTAPGARDSGDLPTALPVLVADTPSPSTLASAPAGGASLPPPLKPGAQSVPPARSLPSPGGASMSGSASSTASPSSQL